VPRGQGVSGAVVAVVNDDPDACEVMARLLEQDGHQVIRIHDAGEAVAGASGRVDLLVLDLMEAGHGANLALLERIRGAHDRRVRGARAVFIGRSESNALFSWQSGADGFLSRPFHADDLRREVTAVLGRPENERAAYRSQAEADALSSEPPTS
jgi:DNA-binding response OmpR family regulator